MRLMRMDMKNFKLFRTEKVQSGYVGTILQESLICGFQAAANPVTDNLSFERYGEKVENMTELTVIKSDDCEICHGDIFTDEKGQKFKVVSVQDYSSHWLVTGEKQ